MSEVTIEYRQQKRKNNEDKKKKKMMIRTMKKKTGSQERERLSNETVLRLFTIHRACNPNQLRISHRSNHDARRGKQKSRRRPPQLYPFRINPTASPFLASFSRAPVPVASRESQTRSSGGE
jgi:hypothetical protein